MALLDNIEELLLTLSDQEIDKLFNLQEALTSDTRLEREAYTDGLISSEALYTTYKDFFQIYLDVKKRGIQSFADLGAGNGRSKLLFDLLKAPFQTTTYEFVPERVQATKEAYSALQLPDHKNIKEMNLLEEALPDHDAYFLYLPVGATLDHLVEELKNLSISRDRFLYVIESHGDLLNYLKKSFTTLELLKSIPLNSKRHDPHLHVFQLRSCEKQLNREKELIQKAQSRIDNGFSLKTLLPFEIYALLKHFGQSPLNQIVVKEAHMKWMASIEGWKEGPTIDSIETLFPSRIIYFEQIDSLLKAPKSLAPFIQKRRDREFEKTAKPSEKIRKIILSNPFKIEFASGEIKKGP